VRGNPEDDAPARDLAGRMAEAATAWLEMPDPQQRAALHA
jgi:hypothetical protein